MFSFLFISDFHCRLATHSLPVSKLSFVTWYLRKDSFRGHPCPIVSTDALEQLVAIPHIPCAALSLAVARSSQLPATGSKTPGFTRGWLAGWGERKLSHTEHPEVSTFVVWDYAGSTYFMASLE